MQEVKPYIVTNWACSHEANDAMKELGCVFDDSKTHALNPPGVEMWDFVKKVVDKGLNVMLYHRPDKTLAVAIDHKRFQQR